MSKTQEWAKMKKEEKQVSKRGMARNWQAWRITQRFLRNNKQTRVNNGVLLFKKQTQHCEVYSLLTFT